MIHACDNDINLDPPIPTKKVEVKLNYIGFISEWDWDFEKYRKCKSEAKIVGRVLLL